MSLQFPHENHKMVLSCNEPQAEVFSARRSHLEKTLLNIETQILRYEDEVHQLRTLLKDRIEERDRLQGELQAMGLSNTGRAGGSGNVDYVLKEFEWTRGLKAKMKNVFGIANFRLCQEG